MNDSTPRWLALLTLVALAVAFGILAVVRIEHDPARDLTRRRLSADASCRSLLHDELFQGDGEFVSASSSTPVSCTFRFTMGDAGLEEMGVTTTSTCTEGSSIPVVFIGRAPNWRLDLQATGALATPRCPIFANELTISR